MLRKYIWPGSVLLGTTSQSSGGMLSGEALSASCCVGTANATGTSSGSVSTVDCGAHTGAAGADTVSAHWSGESACLAARTKSATATRADGGGGNGGAGGSSARAPAGMPTISTRGASRLTSLKATEQGASQRLRLLRDLRQLVVQPVEPFARRCIRLDLQSALLDL